MTVSSAAAIGIDIGGTKIELQVFASDWTQISRSRTSTPHSYPELIDAIAALVTEADSRFGPVPLGISAAGLVERRTGLAVTANLPANGQPFPADIAARCGRPVAFINDCRAMALSEASLGFARDASRVLGLVLGTGVGSGFIRDGVAEEGASGIVAELGHIALPASLIQRYNLPLLHCGCGRMGCFETLVSGPGLARIAKHLTGRDLTPPEVAKLRYEDATVAHVWGVWCGLVAELLVAATLTLDPDVVVLGGGLSSIDGVSADLTTALEKAHIAGLAIPQIGIAQGGDASGARGAALAAIQMRSDHQ